MIQDIENFSENNNISINIIEIIKNKMRDRVRNKYQSFISSRMSVWFPMIFIVRSSYYNSNNSSNLIASKCKVLNGSMKLSKNNDAPKYIPEYRSSEFGFNNIGSWLNNIFNIRDKHVMYDNNNNKVCNRRRIRKKIY